jgi:putative PIN family toxin of toxin-antitoxin system
MTLRIVVDTNVVVSALVFSGSHLGWLRSAWQSGLVKPLVSRPVVDELIRVLKYPKFQLEPDEREGLLAEYLPWCEAVTLGGKHGALPRCRDPDDVKFLELAISGEADFLVTGDADLLSLAPTAGFAIVTAQDLRGRLAASVHERRSPRYVVGIVAGGKRRRASRELDLGRPRGKEVL